MGLLSFYLLQRRQSSQGWQRASWNHYPCLLEILANLHYICSNGNWLNSLHEHKNIFLYQPEYLARMCLIWSLNSTDYWPEYKEMKKKLVKIELIDRNEVPSKSSSAIFNENRPPPPHTYLEMRMFFFHTPVRVTQMRLDSTLQDCHMMHNI